MKRMTITLRNQTAANLDKLSAGVGCSRSALIEVLLSDAGMDHLLARLAYQQDLTGSHVATKRYTGDSIREIEESIEQLKHNYQGELWDAAD